MPNFNNIDVNLYTVTLEKLMDTVKADIYSEAMQQDGSEMQKHIKEIIFATTHLDKMEAALEFLKNRYVKKYNIWERFFKPLIADPVRWEELLTSFIANRNHVAHNKLLDYMSKETMLSDTREFRRFIREAVVKFDEENCSEEVEETLQAIADQREYEQEARMEIISNSLAHRDYSSGYVAKMVIEKDRIFAENSNRTHGYGNLNLNTFEPFPKNPAISKVFREIGLADELGSGMRNTYKFTKLYSGGIPQFVEGDVFKTVIPLNETATMKSGPKASDQVSDQVGDQVSDQVGRDAVAEKILEFCKTARTKKEISEHIGYKNLTYMTRTYIKPLLESGKLAYTIPEKPQSRLQKYVTKQ